MSQQNRTVCDLCENAMFMEGYGTFNLSRLEVNTHKDGDNQKPLYRVFKDKDFCSEDCFEKWFKRFILDKPE